MDLLKLLDFRIGRANRGQYWLYGGLCLSPITLFNFFPVPNFIALPITLICLYPFVVLSFRRMRDLGLSVAKEADNIHIFPDPNLRKTIFGHETHDHRLRYYGLFPILFQKGQELENEYGYPPDGLGLKSMIAQDYSENQKAKPVVSEYTDYKNSKVETMKNAFVIKEFKGRDL